MYKAYVFDIDGTLLDTAPTILNYIAQSITLSGLKVDRSAINQKLIGPKIAEIIEILGLSHKEEDKQIVVKHFRELYDNAPISETKPYFQGMALLRQAQKETSNLFIATNKPIKPTEKLLQHFKLECFKDVYTPNRYADKVISKTDMLQEIISKNHFQPENILFIGDTKGDLDAARATGCKFAFATWGYAENKAEIREQSDIILDENSLNLI